MTHLCGLGDPLQAALEEAPQSEELLTEGDNAALHEARVALEAGHVLSDKELCAELGL